MFLMMPAANSDCYNSYPPSNSYPSYPPNPVAGAPANPYRSGLATEAPYPYRYDPVTYNPYTNYWPAAQPVRARRQPVLLPAFLALLLVLGVLGAIFLQTARLELPGLPAVGAEEQAGFGFTIQPNDPLYDRQYALQRINATAAWSVTGGRSSVVVAVIDTGVDASHPDLQGKLVKGYDFVNNDNTPEDTVGHGTFVASLIVADGDNKLGIVGLAPGVRVMPLKALVRQGGDSPTIARAIRYAVDNGAQVINLSLGGPYPSRSVRQAIEYAVSRNVVVVAASGNDGSRGNSVEYPAAFPGVISVGATGPRDTAASFSTHNRYVSLAAPGVNIFGARSAANAMCRAYAGQPYCLASGTSFAAPYVAATAALMLSANPQLKPGQVKDILTQTATDLGPAGRDEYYGAGLLNAGKAVQNSL